MLRSLGIPILISVLALPASAGELVIPCKPWEKAPTTCENRTQIGPILRVYLRSPYFQEGHRYYVMVATKARKEALQALLSALDVSKEVAKVYTPEEEPFVANPGKKGLTASDRKEIESLKAELGNNFAVVTIYVKGDVPKP
jgi:hypothetical protein